MPIHAPPPSCRLLALPATRLPLLASTAALLPLLIFTACNGPPPPLSVTDVSGLITALNQRGLNARPTGEDIHQSFFMVEGFGLTTPDGAIIQAYQYPTEQQAEADAGKVSADGSSIAATMVHWVSTPHFYRSEPLIVIYVGDEEDIVSALTESMGEQFAGR